MTLEQLRIFLAVAEHLHFTRAAEALYITQPAVSAAIQCLEGEYRVKLFHRLGRRIEITDAGRLLQSEAQNIFEQVRLLERNLRELNNLQRGELYLGASLTIGNYWLPDKICLFNQRHPGIAVHCVLANAEEICEGTAAGRFDLGLVTGDLKPSLQEKLQQETVGLDRMQIVVGQNHPWFMIGQVTVDDLLQTHWIMREPGSGGQQLFEQALVRWNIAIDQLNVALVLNSSEMVKAVVESGTLASAMPELMIRKELKIGTLRAIKVVSDQSTLSQPLSIIQKIIKIKHRQRYQTQIVTAFEKILIE
ncbi:LysR substrate-binding domain-containing protein [Alkalinema pantanalense CENA528]|uniref:LysR substrate-binding domain-containing protein n=1 Tax=Alkalinema pantanalense TaxID=1620705 RepID=UPI003D6E41D2